MLTVPGERPCHCVSMLTRRELLTAAAVSGAALLGACGTGADVGPQSQQPVGGDEALRRDVAQAERALIAQYDAAIATAPAALSTLLTRIRDEHRDHLASMAGSSTAATSTPATVSLAALRAAERDAARTRRTAAVAATDGELARVLTLIAASESGHLVALREVGA